MPGAFHRRTAYARMKFEVRGGGQRPFRRTDSGRPRDRSESLPRTASTRKVSRRILRDQLDSNSAPIILDVELAKE